MALVLADRVLETTTSTGSGTITLAGAEPGYQSFAVVGNANQTYYTIAGDTQWEVGIGTYTSSGTTLSRDTVLSSSASGTKVGFSAGQKKVFVTYPSEKSVNFDLSGNITAASGRIINLGAPSLQSDAATKEYVDNMSSAALHIHEAVVLTTPADSGRNDNYNNGTAGVSATLTATANGTLVIDSTVAQAAQRVLIKDCDDQAENGIYVVTTVGTASTPYVMTRASDADTYGQQGANSLDEGSYFFTTGGTTQKGAAYVCNTAGTITFGTTPITFAEFSQAQVYSAGNGISITLGSIALNTPVTVASGGTGLTTSPANGQLLIGNGSNYTLSTLTAGSGVSITNSAGSITLSATGLGGTVTAVTATGPLASSGGTTPDISIANSTGTGSVVLDQGATISSATITAAVSASITTITGSSANITTVTGTTARFSSAAITQLSGTSAGITTVSGTTTTFSSGTITQFGATSATIASVSGTNVTYSNGNFTSATVTTASGTNLSYGSLTLSSGANIAGNVGVGTTSPSGRMTVSEGNKVIDGVGNFNVFTTTAQAANLGGQIALGGLNGSAGAFDPWSFATIKGAKENSTSGNFAGYLALATPNSGGTISERMRIDSSGNVGIGTTSPDARLDVDAGATALAARVQGTNSPYFSVLDNDNNVEALVAADGGGFSVFGSISNHAVQFRTNNTEKMRITAAGLVGILKTPSTALDVSGTITGVIVTGSAGSFTNAGISSLTLSRVAPAFIVNKQNTTGEGGEFALEKSDTSTLGGNLNIDLVAQTFRIFEGGGTARGANLDISACAAGAGSILLTNTNASSYVSGLPVVNVTSSTSIAATTGNHYILRGGATTVTLPASPAAGNIVWVTVANGRSDNVIARNGQNIQGLAENMTLDTAYAAVQLRFSDATMGWVFC